MKDATVSIITPAYNAENHIAHMIESVLQQPVAVELIIVNDGSLDKTGEICERYACEHNTIRYVNVPNGGAGRARNIGIEQASGDFIIFLDSDDLLFSDKLNVTMMEYLALMNQKKVDIIYTARCKTDINLNSKPIITAPESDIQAHMPRLEFWTCIYRREFLVDNNIRFFEYRLQDIETAFRYRAFSKAENVVIEPSKSFYLQRDNLNSNMHTFNRYNLHKIKAIVYDELIDEMHDLDKLSKDAAYLKLTIIESVFQYVKQVVRNGFQDINSTADLDLMLKLFEKHRRIPLKDMLAYGSQKATRGVLECIYIRLKSRSAKKSKVVTQTQTKHTTVQLRYDSWEEINKRLSRWSEELSQSCMI